ncbi:MAG TPA: hypothetical protein VIW94_06750 [Acidimicrobiia bacterium]
MVDNTATDAGQTKRNWTFPLIVLLVVVALTVVALLREPVALDPTTPEGTVQVYLQALADNDYEAALQQTTTEIQEACTAQDISDNFYYDSFTATLGATREMGTVTVVEVAINQTDVGVSSGYFEQIELTDEEGGWAITGDPWPYFTYACFNI